MRLIEKLAGRKESVDRILQEALPCQLFSG